MPKITLSSIWYTSQLATIVFSIHALITSHPATYTLAYLSIVVSLVISLYQALTAEKAKSKSSSSPTTDSLRPTESSQPKDWKQNSLDFIGLLQSLIKPAQSHPTTPYVLLAIAYLILLPKFKITLIPFLIFAFFHAINYTRTFILPILPVNESFKIKGKSILESINNKFHEKAFQVAVWIQLFSFSFLSIWAIVTTPLNLIGYGDGHLLINWISVVVWYFFINVLQTQNLLMKAAINEIVTSIDGVAADPRIPQGFKTHWANAKQIIKSKQQDHSQ